jgi:hypothetical protein
MDLHHKIGNETAALMLKYADMDKLFGGKLDIYKGKKHLIDTVNIFINFESLYNTIRKKNYERILEAATKKEVKAVYRHAISEFINVAAHYREYFNRHRISTNIIYYYNSLSEEYIEYNNCAMMPGYREHFIESTTAMDRYVINGLIADSIPFMEIISEYIDGMYIVGSKRVEASCIPYIIMLENKFPANMNIIVTKDKYDYQYVNMNCLVITKHNLDPVILTKRNVMKFVRFLNDMPDERDVDGKKIKTPEISPYLLPFIYATQGDRKRSIPGIKGYGFKSVYNDLVKLYDVGYIFDEEPETMSCANLCRVISSGGGVTKFKDDDGELADVIAKYYRCFDIPYQVKVASKDQIKHIMSHLKNKYDDQALRDINDKYFDEFPLRLMELTRFNAKGDTDLLNAMD